MKKGLVEVAVVTSLLVVTWAAISSSMPNCKRNWIPELARIEACMNHPDCKVTSHELDTAKRLRVKIKQKCDTGEDARHD